MLHKYNAGYDRYDMMIPTHSGPPSPSPRYELHLTSNNSVLCAHLGQWKSGSCWNCIRILSGPFVEIRIITFHSWKLDAFFRGRGNKLRTLWNKKDGEQQSTKEKLEDEDGSAGIYQSSWLDTSSSWSWFVKQLAAGVTTCNELQVWLFKLASYSTATLMVQYVSTPTSILYV